MRLLRAPAGDAVHAAAAAALRNMACGASGRSRIAELGGLERLVRLCEERSPPLILFLFLQALRYLPCRVTASASFSRPCTPPVPTARALCLQGVL